MKTYTDDPSSAPTALVGFVFVVLVVITVIGLQAYFGRAEKEEFEAKVVGVPNLDRARIQLEQREEMAQYRWLDRETGTVGIPIEQAMEIVVRDLAGESGGSR